MGKLIIDGNSVFEIDEQCLKKRKIPPNCDLDKYMSKIGKKEEKKRPKIRRR